MNRRALLRSVARRGAPLVALAFLGLLLTAPSAVAVEGAKWRLTVTPNADYVLPGTQFFAEYKIELENVGGAPTSASEAVTIENIPPAGTVSENAYLFNSAFVHGQQYINLATSDGMCPSSHTCIWPSGPFGGLIPKQVAVGQRLIMTVLVNVPAGVEGTLEDTARVSGGGLPTLEAAGVNTATTDPPFGMLHFDSSLPDASQVNPYTRAGGHPYQFVTELNFADYSATTFEDPQNPEWERFSARPLRDPKEVVAELPPGLVVDPQAIPSCTLAKYFSVECPLSTAAGWAGIRTTANEGAFNRVQPIFNLQPSGQYPGELGIPVANAPFIVITAGVRSGGDYGVSSSSVAIQASLNRIRITLWGTPADPSHDTLRGKVCTDTSAQDWAARFLSADQIVQECEDEVGVDTGGISRPAGVPATPLITMPTECSGNPLAERAGYNSWQVPGEFARASIDLPAVGGCNQLAFSPTIEASPTTDLADTPSGLQFHLHIPQGCWDSEEAPSFETLCQSDLKEAVVKLPKGLVVNPSSGNGLVGCSPEAVGMKTAVGETPAHFTEEPAHCPGQSAIGTAEVDTPLLHNPLKGMVYLATPHQNPFESLLAAYIVLEGEGLIFKLPGKIEADPENGQLTSSFLENPQLPFEDFRLNFFGGARGDLRTPAVCGSYETAAVLTPYSHLEGEEEATPITEPKAEFETTAAPHEGEACARKNSKQPNTPTFRAGTESPQAGAFAPFALKLAREDGSQEIEKIETTLPEGLTAKLAGVAECPEAQIALAKSREHEGGGAEEQANPSCPASSEVGTVQVASGAGPTPLYVQGKAYLAGPYKGAPLSLAIITPAVAGPFDLGDVVVRTALYTAPYNAQIKAVSDPIPHILQGIPLDVRSITLKMARPDFTLNPTDCEEMGFTGTETSLLGNVAPLTQRFQVGGCGALPFKPKLAISLKGGVKRSTFPALTATVTMPGGQANIGKAQVTLPHNEQLEQAHITSQVCLQAQLATQTCPPASIYGYAKAQTPLLDHPLEGPVYLGVGFGHKLPDLVAELNGQIRVLLHGKVDTGREDGLRNTFEVVPDAPVSKFTLHMFGGKKGLIVNSENLCGKHAKRKALARFTAQSGKVVELEPTVKNSCKKKGKKKGKGHRKRGGGK